MSSTVKITPLSTELRDAILNDVLDWELDTPAKERTDSARMVSSREIASRHGVSPLQVGGVRSNMAAGRYGSMNTLRRKRRKSRVS